MRRSSDLPSATGARSRALRGGVRAPASRGPAPRVVPVRASRTLTLAGGLAAAALALLVGGWGLGRVVRVERAVATPPPPPVPGRGPELVIRGVRMVETKDGAKLWEVRADQAEVFEKDGVSRLRQIGAPVEVVLHSSQGALTASAGEAVIDLKTKDVTLRGDVRGRSDKGTDLRTASLYWVAATRRLHTGDPVILSRGGLVSVGKGLEAETSLEKVRLLGGISSQVAAPPEAAPPPDPGGRAGRPGRRPRGR